MTFILIQDGIVDVTDRPCRLHWEHLLVDAGWKVAIGIVNEFGEREIAGIVAEVYATGEWCPRAVRISSEMDGLDALIDGYPSVPDFVLRRLDSMYCRGRFNDPANLPQPVILRPDRLLLSASM
jgi:hypothetical protein